MKKRYRLTLLEMMIVIFLIGVIGSVVGFNMKKSLDKAKEFRTAAAKERLEDILNMELAKGRWSPDYIIQHKKAIVGESGLVKDVEQALRDGWNNPFEVVYDETTGQIAAVSPHA